MSLYGPTFHVTPVDLGIIFQCKLYISCIVSCGNKISSNCFKSLSVWFLFCHDMVTPQSINTTNIILDRNTHRVA